MQEIITLLDQIGEITKRHEEITKLSGENFNVFKVIGVTTKEVKLHSRFLGELLNPSGSHGQGDIFLSLFIDEINKNEELKIEKFDTKNSVVFIEKRVRKINEDKTEGGQIDILIEDKNGNKTIIIENKIYADDQKNQLIRYSNYKKENIVGLFYLTLFGTEPSEISKGELKENKDYFLLSYNENIIVWLEKCRKEAVQQPLLREGLSHYINVIKLLTNQTTNEAMNNDIVNTLTNSTETFKNALSIEKGVIDAKIEIQWSFWEKLRLEFEKKGYKFNVIVEKKLVEKFYSPSRKKKYGIRLVILQKEEFNIEFDFFIDENIHFGFMAFENGVNKVAIQEKYNKYVQIINNINQNYERTSWWLGWRYVEPKLNFREFNQNVIDLVYPEKLEETVNKIIEDAIQNIKKFKEEINR